MSVDKEKVEKVRKTLLDLPKEDRAEIKTAEAMEDMLRLEGWKFYQKVLDVHLNQQRLLAEGAPLDHEDGNKYSLRMERIKGTIIGLRLALELPSVMIAAGKELRTRSLGTEETGS